MIKNSAKDELGDILDDTMYGYSIHLSKYQRGIGTVARRNLKSKLEKRIEALITTHQRKLLERIDKEVIGADEAEPPLNKDGGIDVYKATVEGYNLNSFAHNQLRAEQRKALKAVQLEKEGLE